MNHVISLNGGWTFDWLSEHPYLSETEPPICKDSDSAVTCPVPGYWEDLTDLFRMTSLHTKLCWNPMYTLQRYPQAGYVPDLFLPNPVGCFVYWKNVVLDAPIEAETVLYIGGAQNTVSAWINGRYLGRHEGYSTPFTFSIPTGVLVKGENQIVLTVSNIRLTGYMDRPVSGLTSRAANECTGGIYGDVELHIYPDGLRDLWVSTSHDCANFTVHTVGALDSIKTVRIFDGEKRVCEIEIPKGESECRIEAKGYTLWSPYAPKLYTAEASTTNGAVSVRFGIRRLTVDGTRLLLNGEPYFFRGICEHCYQPITVHPTRNKIYYRMIIRKLKELGFNSIRFHTWVPPYEYMEAADELGMLIEVESPNNTSFEEWHDVVRFCRHHASVNLYSTGNELQIDGNYEKHLKKCADLVHSETDSLFSPMSAMRGIEYHFEDDETVSEPFIYNPRRLAAVGEYCDVYNSFSNRLTSYSSASGSRDILDKRNAVYGKPLLSHEICIHGTYINLSLEDRYKGTRIGDTEFMSSVRRHLGEKGLLDRANTYYRNSAAWQRILRKHCFETVRRCETFAGYDFLGDIDTHWHTFGYCVGMMNEFYELKAGETVENVLRYNSDTVLLADLPPCINYSSESMAEIPVLVSHYGKAIPEALLQIRISGDGSVLYRREIRTGKIPRGVISELYRISFKMPECSKPMHLKLNVSLSGGDTDCENCWDLYVFPRNNAPTLQQIRDASTLVLNECGGDELMNLLNAGRRVVLFGTGPFPSNRASWQIAVAGRTGGHLATVIADHPLMEDFPHEGYCGRQFEHMLNHSKTASLDITDLPHRPIIDIATTYKNARREAVLFEYRVGNGRLLVCTLNLAEDDPAAQWLKNRIISYALSEKFEPAQALSNGQFTDLCKASSIGVDKNANEAMNKNDITV